MKPITLDLMTEYSYLSDLKISKDQKTLYFTQTMADMDNNDYKQRVYQLDTNTKESTLLLDWRKRVPSFTLNDGFLLVENDKEDTTLHTRFVWVNQDGTTKEAFKLPLLVNTIQDLDDTSYLVSATINQLHPKYHYLSYEERLDEEAKKKADNDYIILDEYPYFFNGIGFINGDRNALFKVNKETLEITELTPLTLDVESFDVNGEDIIYSGVDYTEVKHLWSSIWKVNYKTLETEVLYDKEDKYIGRLFYYQDKVYVTASEDRCIDGKRFYLLENKEMTKVYHFEGSLHNSVGTDCRYGKLKNYYKHNGVSYFMSTVDSRAPIFKFTGTSLETVLDYEGTNDDLIVTNEGIYVIAMKDQKLQEVYFVENNTMTQLTHLNTAVYEDTYVAKPERLSFENAGDTIYGWVLKPKDYDPTKTYPAILDIHGGPKTAYGEIVYHEMQAWASLGYFVMYCNPHCSDGRDDAFVDYLKHYGATDFDDIMKFVDTVLETYPEIDKERLGVTGGSYGGYMTNWIIGHTHRFKAAASQRSVSNRIAQMIYSDYGIDVPFEFGVDPDNCYDLFWDRSPIKYINNAKTPTLFIHSTNDWRCPIPEALQMYTVLKCRGVDTKLVGFKGENHELSRSGKPTHRLRRLHEITDWMEKYLK